MTTPLHISVEEAQEAVDSLGQRGPMSDSNNLSHLGRAELAQSRQRVRQATAKILEEIRPGDATICRLVLDDVRRRARDLLSPTG